MMKRLFFYSSVLCLLLITTISFGATKTFTGDSSDLWSDADNWSPIGVPATTDDIVLNGNDVDFGSTNITIADISVTQSTDIDGDGTLTFQNLTISNNKTFITGKDVVLSQASTYTSSFGNKSHWTIKHSKSGTTITLGIINLGDYSRLIWTGQRNATVHDLNLADYNLVEFTNGVTTFGVAQDWDEDCNTAAILRSRLAGNDARLVFVGSGNTGQFNVYEDVNSTGNTMDIANSKKLTVVGNFTGGSSATSTIVSAGSGDFNDGASWVGGCTPKHLDSVVILNGHTIDIPAQYYARVNHLYIEGTGNVDGPNSGVLEIEGNLRVNSETCFNAFTGVTEFRSIADALMINLSGNTIKFNGPVRKEIAGTTLTLQDSVWFESTASGRGDITITRGTIDCGSFNVYLENDLNVGGNGTLVPGTSTWIAKGTAGEITTLDIDGTGHFYDLVLDKENDVDFIECQSDIEVSNSFTLNTGICQSFSSALLILRDGATSGVGNSTSYVDGPMKKVGDEAFTYPVGDRTGGANYFAPIGITAPSVATDAFTAEYFFAEPTDRTSFVSALTRVSAFEYWDLSRDAGSSSVSITLAFNTFSSLSGNIGTLADLRVSHYESSGSGEWEDMGLASSTGTAASGTITSNSVSSFSPFTLGSVDANPIPVEFINISANTINEIDVEINWSVASELNNEGFYVERFNNMTMLFEEIGFVPSAGNTNTIRHYNLLDKDANKGQNLYRVKQVDFSGKFTYTVIVAAVVGESADPVVVYPNPATDELTIDNSTELITKVTLLDITGRLVLTQPVLSNQVKVSAADLPKGTYLLQVKTETESYTKRIILH